MPIIATFNAGATQVNVNGLHQWDYGQTLEIHDGTLPSGVCEVHFSCEGMTEAVVRSCSVVNGVLSAVIPDRCLEQSSPVTAWVYEIGEASGRTSRVVVLPIIARIRPATSAEVPQEVGDKYTEAVAAMNELLWEMQYGGIIAAKATHAEKANLATTAEHADRATLADMSDTASKALMAERDGQGNEIAFSYMKQAHSGFSGIPSSEVTEDLPMNFRALKLWYGHTSQPYVFIPKAAGKRVAMYIEFDRELPEYGDGNTPTLKTVDLGIVCFSGFYQIDGQPSTTYLPLAFGWAVTAGDLPSAVPCVHGPVAYSFPPNYADENLAGGVALTLYPLRFDTDNNHWDYQTGGEITPKPFTLYYKIL